MLTIPILLNSDEVSEDFLITFNIAKQRGRGKVQRAKVIESKIIISFQSIEIVEFCQLNQNDSLI